MDGIDEIIMNGATESCCNVVSIKPNMKPNIKQAIFNALFKHCNMTAFIWYYSTLYC